MPFHEVVMPLSQVVGLDHVVIAVRDLDASAKTWSALGFTISPRGLHSAHLGSGNYTIMFGPDYIELLGIVTPTDHNAGTRAFLDKREGLERSAFTAVDATKGVAELIAKGIAATGPLNFSRPVDLPDGGKSEARFSTMHWPGDEKPGGMRIFACQHLTREAVWIPELQVHRNTAKRIDRVEILSADPIKAAAHMARLIDQTPVSEPDGAIRVPSGSTRAAFVFLSEAVLRARYPGVVLGTLPAEGAISLCIRVDDDEAALAAAGPSAVTCGPGRVVIPPAAATGVLIELATG
jgi:catechol 2,3-dioxygenase-like lactoylglutathione lyase family enzyme